MKDLHNCYLRYIDDIFMIWTSSKEQFENFIQEINSQHPTTKFDYEIHHKDGFDTTVLINSDEKLKTKLYRKQHMASTTFTPNLNIQALRIRKFCRGNGFYYQLETLRDAFQKRRYEKDFAESQIEEAESISRQ